MSSGFPEALVPLVYEELRSLATRYMRSGSNEAIAPTSIVHEAFLKLREGEVGKLEIEHFRALAATAMRQVLIDRARRRSAARRGGGWERVTLSIAFESNAAHQLDLVELDDALQKLEALDPRQARIVELRFFGGLSVPEVAKVMELSTSTVEKEWRRARAWLGATLGG